MKNMFRELLSHLQDLLNNQEQWRTYNPGLKIRTVWVGVTPSLLQKATDLRGRVEPHLLPLGSR